MNHFTISELLKSDTAIKKKIWNGANREQEDNLTALVTSVLDPLRERFGKTIYVSSGFRCEKVNRSVNGETSSQHMRGEAADIYAMSGKQVDKALNKELGRLIILNGSFDQVIFENVGKNDLNPEWIHVSWKRKGDNRREIRKKVKGVVGYPIVDKKEVLG